MPTTIGPSSSDASAENTPHPVTSDMDAIADKFRRDRFRFNTRTLLDEPRQGGQDHIAAPRRSSCPDGGAFDVREHHLFVFFRL
ncbi:hypothetical protein [Streptomyces beigongshangae]|uniref:hypothetical protein n=1 Tax=Streptomyces beigongshangae TaxID=2841597 RepID=UPI0021A48D64|nr:hypothetical protein [Streptomyces sp. REN17]